MQMNTSSMCENYIVHGACIAPPVLYIYIRLCIGVICLMICVVDESTNAHIRLCAGVICLMIYVVDESTNKKNCTLNLFDNNVL
jgi:hypothetical protein